MREGKNSEAREALQQLVGDAAAPEGLRARANGLLARLGVCDRMSRNGKGAARRAAGISRRAALGLPLGLAGCGLFDEWLGEDKPPLPGNREPVVTARRGMEVDEAASARKIVLPPPVENAAWPQAGGNPAHVMGHLAAGNELREAWRASIGAGGGYRRRSWRSL